MCIICVSKSGVAQPSADRLSRMFDRNPHGAGYMFSRNGVVHIHKGFMDKADFLKQIAKEGFTADDAVVYHFRISTQAGVTPAMTHPFPLSTEAAHLRALDIDCPCGIAHNGVISMTSTKHPTMSDTALFIQRYMHRIVRTPDDLRDKHVLEILQELIGWSKLAILDSSGYIATVGSFVKDDGGILYSNHTYRDIPTKPFPLQARLRITSSHVIERRSRP